MTIDGRTARGDVRRAMILDGAIRVLATGGTGALTHRAAAQAAAVSLASVTYHFPTISQLRRAVFEDAGTRVGMAFREQTEEAGLTGAAVPTIVADFLASLLDQRRSDARALIELITAAGHDAGLRPLVRLYDGRLASLLAPYLGSRDAADIATAALQGLLLASLAACGPEDPGANVSEQLVSRLHDAALHVIERLRSTQ